MYLHLLNEKQKGLFLKLAVKATETDNVVAEEEKAMLSAFAKEMQVAPVYDVEESTDTLLDKLYEISSKKALRIITFEILGIMFSDSEYDEPEKVFMENIGKKFEISKEDVIEMIDVINEYFSICKKMTKVVFQP
jgi:hypothetical protein